MANSTWEGFLPDHTIVMGKRSAESPKQETRQNLPESFKEVSNHILNCKSCEIFSSRLNLISRSGSHLVKILFVTQHPDSDQTVQGFGFGGEREELFKKMIHAMGLTQENIYVTSMVKCETHPETDFDQQLQIIQPKAIVSLGQGATELLLSTIGPFSKARGIWVNYLQYPVMPTYHPAELLKTPALKKEAWTDLQAVLKKIH